MDDALSKLLQDVRPQGALFSRAVSRAPWSLRFVNGAPVTLVTMVGADAWLIPEPASRCGSPPATWPW